MLQLGRCSPEPCHPNLDTRPHAQVLATECMSPSPWLRPSADSVRDRLRSIDRQLRAAPALKTTEEAGCEGASRPETRRSSTCTGPP